MAARAAEPPPLITALEHYLREPVNGMLHFSAFLASLVGTAYLLWRAAPDPAKMTILGVYGFSMALVFLGSSCHHLIKGTYQRELFYLKLDHAAIFVFIAGSYTPFLYYFLPVATRGWMIALCWLIAAGGVYYKLRHFTAPNSVAEPPSKLEVAAYVAMGWVGILQVKPMFLGLYANGLALPLIGGICYMLGGLILSTKSFDFRPGLLGHHEIWHLSVIAGSICIFAYVCRVFLPL